MKLQTRFLSVIAVNGLAALVITLFVMQLISSNILERWTVYLVEREAHYNSARILEPLIDDINDTKKLAATPVIINWALDPDDPDKNKAAINYLNSYRDVFRSDSFFAALAVNDSYYYNDKIGLSTGHELRIHLDPENPGDFWFYALLKKKELMHLNIGYDRIKKATNLWIDIQIRDKNKTLGIIGTYFDLTYFINNYVRYQDDNFETLFTDEDGAIQLAAEFFKIEDASVAKNTIEKKLIFDYFQDNDTVTKLKNTFLESFHAPGKVKTVHLQWRGSEKVVGVVYLPELHWYELMAIDVDTILPASEFYPFYILVFLAFVTLLILMYNIVNRYVIHPLSYIKHRIQRIGSPDTSEYENEYVLSSEFRELEQQITSFAYYDPLTQLYNRRGLRHNLSREIAHCRRHNKPLFVILIDIDYFKHFNDTHGHLAGDQALKLVATKLLHHFKRDTDIVARFGGEEFVVASSETSFDIMYQLLESFRKDIESYPVITSDSHSGVFITISAGGICSCLSKNSDKDISKLLDKADEQLYLAKAERNKTVLIKDK